MGRYFAAADRLEHLDAPFSSGQDVTLMAWVYREYTEIGRILAIDAGTAYTGIALRTNGGGAPNLYIGTRQTGSVNAFTLNTWEMILGTYDLSTEVGFVHRNAGGGSDSASVSAATTSGTLDRILISRTNDFGFRGGVAHAAIWNIILSDAERIALYNGGKGMDPRYVRPANLIAYWPLINNDLDVVGTYDLTAYNDPTFVTSPTIWLPSENDMAKGASQPLPPPASRQFMI